MSKRQNPLGWKVVLGGLLLIGSQLGKLVMIKRSHPVEQLFLNKDPLAPLNYPATLNVSFDLMVAALK